MSKDNRMELEKQLEESGFKNKLVIFLNYNLLKIYDKYLTSWNTTSRDSIYSLFLSSVRLCDLGYIKIVPNSPSKIKYNNGDLYKFVFEHHTEDKYKRDLKQKNVYSLDRKEIVLAPEELVNFYLENVKPLSKNHKIEELTRLIAKTEKLLEKYKSELQVLREEDITLK